MAKRSLQKTNQIIKIIKQKDFIGLKGKVNTLFTLSIGKYASLFKIKLFKLFS